MTSIAGDIRQLANEFAGKERDAFNDVRDDIPPPYRLKIEQAVASFPVTVFPAPHGLPGFEARSEAF